MNSKVNTKVTNNRNIWGTVGKIQIVVYAKDNVSSPESGTKFALPVHAF